MKSIELYRGGKGVEGGERREDEVFQEACAIGGEGWRRLTVAFQVDRVTTRKAKWSRQDETKPLPLPVFPRFMSELVLVRVEIFIAVDYAAGLIGINAVNDVECFGQPPRTVPGM
jgi:hypothetical protein